MSVVGRDGAGFQGYLFGGIDIGERAPTGITWKKPISFVDGVGFLGYLFGGIDIRDTAPTRSAYNNREYLLIGRSC
ncbi:MAG: hypothetical protein RLZZ338_2809 [Cyanobacteriota bacterium]